MTDRSIAEILAAVTGEPVEKFQPPDDIEYPERSDLEVVTDADD